MRLTVNQCFVNFVATILDCSFYIGIGAGPAGPVLATPLFFRRFNEIHLPVDIIFKKLQSPIMAHELDHFKSLPTPPF